MSAYSTNTTFADMARRLLAARRVLITTHVKPDGDAIGSTMAMARALHDKGIAADVYLMGPIEPNLISIAGPTPFRLVEREMPDDDYDVALVVDTGAWSQLEPLEAWLKRHAANVLGVDHHPRGDEVAARRIVDQDAVSTTAALVPLLDAMNVALSGGVGGIAEALFVGLATDSGWFRYGNAGADAFALAARLLAAGVDKPRLFQILEENHRPQRLALEARALASLQFALGGSAAIQCLGPDDFTSTGATVEDLTGLVNTPMTVGAVRISILITQTSPGITKVSFRSKPAAPDADPNDFVNVNDLASRFGGGGHVHAAGARVKMNIADAKAAILESLATVSAPASREA